MKTVEAFGGRTDSPEASNLMNALRQANLGSRRTLPTSEVNPVFPNIVPLAEMTLPVAVPVDLSFNYFGMSPTPEVGFGLPAGIDQGSGYVQVTWGTPGAFQHTAKIDGNRGWRHPFTAAYLRVDYVPVDANAAPGWEITGNQIADLGIGAMISPATGADFKPLTRTMYFERSIVSGGAIGFDFRIIPDWAINFKISNVPNNNATVGSALVFDAFVSGLFSIRQNGNAVGYPAYQILTSKYPIPQTGKILAFAADAAGSSFFFTTAMCELAL